MMNVFKKCLRKEFGKKGYEHYVDLFNEEVKNYAKVKRFTKICMRFYQKTQRKLQRKNLKICHAHFIKHSKLQESLRGCFLRMLRGI